VNSKWNNGIERSVPNGVPDSEGSSALTGRLLLVSNRVMHYRVSVYNYFWSEFKRNGWEFSVLADCMQESNRNPLKFRLMQLPFRFGDYRKEICRIRPHAVILFLHLKDFIIWPLLHWLKLRRIPVAFWTKTRNLDDPDNKMRNALFNYVHHMSDALILYTEDLLRFVPEGDRHKVFVANNTINFHDFPEIAETKAEIKRQLGIPFKKVVLFVGRIEEGKNRKKVDHLIDIFRDLTRNDVGLVIAGSGLSEELKSRMNPKNTVYLGEVHDPENLRISRVFKMADICSIPGHVGLGLNQAFFFGLPMVTEEGKQPPEICYLKSGRNGYMVAEDDIEALQERILYLADNDEVRAQFSANAQSDILEHASVEGMFQGFLKCVNYLNNKRPRSINR
jgi:glycosyltransferase involved in cell wall biosynthesis